MARAATTTDAFAAIAEPARRAILDLLGEGERAVNDLVDSLRISQPSVSKHLRVLLDVGLVAVRRSGRQKLYRVNGAEMKAVHDWCKTFEEHWDHQLLQIKQSAERKASEAGVLGAKRKKRDTP